MPSIRCASCKGVLRYPLVMKRKKDLPTGTPTGFSWAFDRKAETVPGGMFYRGFYGVFWCNKCHKPMEEVIDDLH